ncbi:MAG TPA: M48 family metallopeptidase [bacterium]|nr:M48 family metallopeptidase [bacterium]
MWELIENNKRRSFWLFVCLFVVLTTLGGLIGASFLPPDGAWWGIGLAVLLTLILGVVAYWAGDDIVMSVGQATMITKGTNPQLYNIVEEMQIAAGFGRMPEVYIVADDAMNAFATGIRPEKSAIAVTSGLVENLSRDELQGVVAHEMSHIVNRDVLFMTFSGVLLGSITMLSEGFLRGIFYTGGSRRSKLGSSSRSHPALILITIIFALLAPLLAKIFYFAISRKREYLADATAVRLTRYPEGLAGALEKIAGGANGIMNYNRFTAPLFIIDPQEMAIAGDGQDGKKLFSIGSTHPPVNERIQILRKLSGASYRDYQSAFMSFKKEGDLIPDRMLRDKTAVPLRKGVPGPIQPGGTVEPTKKQKTRDIGDLLMAAGGFIFLPCACGLKVKIPPTLGRNSIPCPRCGRILFLPAVTPGVAHADGDAGKKLGTDGEESTLVYERRSDSWESFACDCGYPIQLSPLFSANAIQCRNCKKKIEIRYPNTTR